MSKNKVTLHRDNRLGRANTWLVRWHGDFNPNTGKQRRYCKGFRTKKQAENFQTQKQSELDNGDIRDLQKITIQELCNQFLKSNKHTLRHATKRKYIYTIEQLNEFFTPTCQISRITRQKAEQFISTREIIHPDHLKSGKELSSWGRSGHQNNAHAIFASAVDWEYIKKNPFSKIKKTKPIEREWHYFTAEEYQAILNKTPNLRLKCFYSVMRFAGLRYGEAINLRWNGRDIDFEKNRINIKNRNATHKIPPFLIKDHESRSVPIPSWLGNMLAELQQESEPGCPFVFLTLDRWKKVQQKWNKMRKAGKSEEWENRHMANNMLSQFKRYCKKAGINTDEKLTLHCLRKSYAQTLADHGTPISTLMHLLGHSSVRVTGQYYIRSTDANEERACQILDNMFDKKNNIDTDSIVKGDDKI